MSTDLSSDPPPPDPAAPTGEGRPRARGGTLLWHHAWTIVFAANLVAPTMFARGMVGEGGRVGMGLAVALLWLAGDLAGVRSPRSRPVLLGGGLAVALTQFVPLLQIIAGLIGLGAGRLILTIPQGEFGLPGELSGPAAFLVTFVTGAVLMLAVWLVGLTLVAIARVLT